MKTFICVLTAFFFVQMVFATTVPVRWLEGERGFEQALQIQKEANVPIIVWTTWNDCPHCAKVTAFLNASKTRQALKDYPHVIIDEHGSPKEAAFAAAKGFHGGNFYVLAANSSKPKAKVWAWQGKDDSRVMVEDLDAVLVEKLAAAK